MGFNIKVLLSMALLVALPLMANAFVWNVGDSAGWSAQAHYNYTQWAMKKFFIPTDSLDFIYDPLTTGVIEVTADDFKACCTASPLAAYNTGNDTIPLKKAGNRYFIASSSCDCKSGLKVNISVTDNPYIVFWRNGPTYDADGNAINIPEPEDECTGTPAGGAPTSAPESSPASPKPKPKPKTKVAPTPARSPASPKPKPKPKPKVAPTPERSPASPKPKPKPKVAPTPSRSPASPKPKPEPKDEGRTEDPKPTRSPTPKPNTKDEGRSEDPNPTRSHTSPKPKPGREDCSTPEEGSAPASSPAMSPTSTDEGRATPASTPTMPPKTSSASKYSLNNVGLVAILGTLTYYVVC